MQNPKVCLSIVILLVFSIKCVSAQEIEKRPINISVQVQGGYVFAGGNWDIKHPIYNGRGGVTWETIDGSFDKNAAFAGGFELLRGYVGFQVNGSLKPSGLKINNPVRKFDFNVYSGEFAFLLFPRKSAVNKISPFLSVGGGGFKSGGDINNTGYFFSAGAGARYYFPGKLGINFILRGSYFRYHQIQLQQQISKDISIIPFEITVGFIYKI